MTDSVHQAAPSDESAAGLTDRQLLELAAKAAGVKRTIEWLGHGDYNPSWNPLDDDGDAFRLAVYLGIETSGDSDHVYADDCCEDRGALDYAAMRRAIVRAAAATGRALNDRTKTNEKGGSV